MKTGSVPFDYIPSNSFSPDVVAEGSEVYTASKLYIPEQSDYCVDILSGWIEQETQEIKVWVNLLGLMI